MMDGAATVRSPVPVSESSPPDFPPADPVDPPALPDWTSVWADSLQWQPTPAQQAQFQQLYAEILVGNRQMNLTRITAPEDFAEKHLWDSLSGIQPWLVGAVAEPDRPEDAPFRVIDIGTGAGFPGLPIAIAQPTWQVSLLDSTRKKITFLSQLIQTLGLSTVTAMVGRAEEVGQQKYYREQYDLAVIRAVATASVCAEYALPLLRVGGTAVLYRGHWTDAETETLTHAAAELGGAIAAITPCPTPITHGDRHCIHLQKIAPTPASYPRAIGLPEQKPLS